MKEERNSRTGAQGWLERGVEILREEGDRGLTVEGLCSRMGKTKGSFYHHFASRDDFVARLLEHWERNSTGRVIEELAALETPRQRLRELGERTVREVDQRLERTLRLWGEREAAAREVVGRVDRAREGYLREQFEAATGDPRAGLLAARAHLAILVGTQMLYLDLPHSELRELNAFVDRLGFFPERRSTETAPTEETP